MTLSDKLLRQHPDAVSATRDGCAEWRHNTVQGGYGRVRHGGRHWLAHRLVWTHHYGPIPAGKVVRHKCDNPPCCNPEHLELGTHRDNSDDKIARGRARYVKGTGHPAALLTPDAVREIRKLTEAGEQSHRAIASRYGVSRATVTAIHARRNWKDLS